MKQLVLVGEDSLCCALGARLMAHALPDWTLALEPLDTQGVTKLIRQLDRYVKVAKHGPAVLCVADTDGKCPVEWLAKWLPKRVPDRFVMRLAVTEAEAWLLADHQGMQGHFGIPAGKLPREPDECLDPKADLLRLLWRHAPRELKQDMVQGQVNPLRCGTGYNVNLRSFVAQRWNPEHAAQRSASLQRAVSRIRQLDSLAG